MNSHITVSILRTSEPVVDVEDLMLSGRSFIKKMRKRIVPKTDPGHTGTGSEA